MVQVLVVGEVEVFTLTIVNIQVVVQLGLDLMHQRCLNRVEVVLVEKVQDGDIVVL